MNTIARRAPSRLAGVAFFALWVSSYMGARLGMEVVEGRLPRIIVAILPIPFFIAFVVHAFRAISRGDELFRRMHLEALALAFPLTLTLLMVLGLLELAIGLNRDDWSYRHVVHIVALFWVGGWVLALRKYK